MKYLQFTQNFGFISREFVSKNIYKNVNKYIFIIVY
jgi:hypothetical protein